MFVVCGAGISGCLLVCVGVVGGYGRWIWCFWLSVMLLLGNLFVVLAIALCLDFRFGALRLLWFWFAGVSCGCVIVVWSGGFVWWCGFGLRVLVVGTLLLLWLLVGGFAVCDFDVI